MVRGLLCLLPNGSDTFAVLEVGTTDCLDSWTKPEEGVEWWGRESPSISSGGVGWSGGSTINHEHGKSGWK